MTNIRKVGNFDNVVGRLVLEDVILDLHKSIAYFMAEENRGSLQELYLEDFAAAVYLLVLLAEHNEFGPRVSASTVQRWWAMYFPMYDERYSEVAILREEKVLRANIVNAFDRLEAFARLHPPDEWRRKEQD